MWLQTTLLLCNLSNIYLAILTIVSTVVRTTNKKEKWNIIILDYCYFICFLIILFLFMLSLLLFYYPISLSCTKNTFLSCNGEQESSLNMNIYLLVDDGTDQVFHSIEWQVMWLQADGLSGEADLKEKGESMERTSGECRAWSAVTAVGQAAIEGHWGARRWGRGRRLGVEVGFGQGWRSCATAGRHWLASYHWDDCW